MDHEFEIDPIITKYVREEPLTAEEAILLQQWIAGDSGRAGLLEQLRNDPEWTKSNLIRIQELPHQRIWEKVESRLQAEGVWNTAADEACSPIIPIRRVSGPNWLRYVVAASILVAAAGITYLFRFNHTAAPAVVVTPAAKPADVQPGGNKATLTLGDGHVLDLDSTADGVLTSQGNTYVAKQDGKLAYNIAASEKPKEPTYNVLATPRAGQFTLALPDGTHVWLNNASSLRYPVWFTGATREVELTGEAYFEVAKDAAHPFRVRIRNSAAGADGGTVEVLGTSFNLMAYADENSERATLVDGSIRYVNGAAKALLHPDDESVFSAKGDLQTLHHVNIDEITAWKNGFFHFDHASLETTMRQLARWYDVTVVYQGTIAPQEFVGKIQRSMTLATVLKGLEGEHVHFVLDGKQVTVTP
jgi:ferric-dicitrate binding protein FerR (iron transport regulator)